MKLFILLAAFVSVLGLASCSSAPKYKQQEYARLAASEDIEADYTQVFKAILAATQDLKIEKVDSDNGKVDTDWIMTESLEKYHEYKVNGLPRKKYLKIRYKYHVFAKKQLGSVNVSVNPEEEVEKLNANGEFDSWMKAVAPDSARANEMLEKIKHALLTLPN